MDVATHLLRGSGHGLARLRLGGLRCCRLGLGLLLLLDPNLRVCFCECGQLVEPAREICASDESMFMNTPAAFPMKFMSVSKPR
jgi:hypothetical protein